MSSTPQRRAHLQVVPDTGEAPTGPSANRLVDAATRAVCRRFGVPPWIAVDVLRRASRTSAHPLRDVAAGVLLSQRLPGSLVTRLRHLGRTGPARRPAVLALCRPDDDGGA